MGIECKQGHIADWLVCWSYEGKVMCDENSIARGVSEMVDGEIIPPAIVPALPEPSKETDDDLPDVIPDVPNAPII